MDEILKKPVAILGGGACTQTFAAQDEYTKLDDAGAHRTVCPEVVGKATKWVAQIVIQENLLP
ncbi:MAG: hypothetical protein OEZ00_06465 [Dehalococcoidia bacterium]|nr:hypothetical protein [Dehalococcoidia bacterium]